jgi:hypothetical protein
MAIFNSFLYVYQRVMDPENASYGVLVDLFLHVFPQGEQVHIAGIALIPHRGDADLRRFLSGTWG